MLVSIALLALTPWKSVMQNRSCSTVCVIIQRLRTAISETCS